MRRIKQLIISNFGYILITQLLDKKTRIRWLKEGDENSLYFHYMVKDKEGSNRIKRLVNEKREVLSQMKDIELDVINFYKRLLESTTGILQGVDKVVVRKGPSLGEAQRHEMIKDISSLKVDLALKGIHQDSAPRVGGMGFLFFYFNMEYCKNRCL